MIIRRKFPQVYELRHPKRGRYWMVSARSVKLGLNERKTFTNQEDALKMARRIEANVIQNGKEPSLPTEKIQSAKSYERILEKLSPYGRTPEEAVDHFLEFLADQVIQHNKPCVRDLADQWREFKFADTITLC